MFYQVTGKRKRKKNNRYGETNEDVNKDDYFDDESGSDESNVNPTRESVASVSEANTSKDEFQSTQSKRTQISRIEAKLDDIKDVVLKVQRMIISLMTKSAGVDISSISKFES